MGAAPLQALATSPELRGDPLADDTIARVIDACDAPSGPWTAIGIVNRELARWQTNADLKDWRASAGTPPAVAAALEAYVRAGSALPDWAEEAKIGRAETLFMEMSMVSCALLFCASLPECYVLPDLAGVLHTAGQLEQHTDYRVRSTAAMIFPVMMQGGLTTPAGGGVAQVLKVRLIHATIRHLILRTNPARVVAGNERPVIAARRMHGQGLYDTLYANGWDIARHGLPCNQQELSYTLLTFHYVFLRGLHGLGIPFEPEDEEAYLHAWNVMGHVLGIERALMPASMAEAKALFHELQQRGRTQSWLPDPRPGLGNALMNMMANEIPLPSFKSFPVLLTRHLCGGATAKDLGLNRRVGLPTWVAFLATMGITRSVDWIVRRFVPQFSLCRMVTRAVGYRLTVRMLMDETRPLKLPVTLLNQVNHAVHSWERDPKAPRWVNRLEAKLAGRQQETA
ncbi:oxygenase MpaB family protein [Pseudoduganella chitinolytica]|uniref:Oxygenase MpaB family protein n=1 Tax=Pseudoduganella chitinolytica TaxID=34070 RepID=A0ABY8BGQ3_9BURK|nr:oxygenase MpaB family protein [Pseudoduganella chitinolytica]WEF33892.1 oxygenase MpaB family protein [Pseudoduganella chitinolytica]